jgi:RimJ/RimL family protein N-acetyltransferase
VTAGSATASPGGDPRRPLPDWQPAGTPSQDLVLRGAYVDLVPVDPVAHVGDLYASGHDPDGDPHLWDFLPYGPFAEEAQEQRFLEEAARSTDPLFRVVIDRATGRAVGFLSLLTIVPVHGSVEIGHVCFGPELQRTPGATEAFHLLARHAFDDLGYRRLVWKCDAANARSRRAAERLGYTFEGTFRQHKVIKGRNRDSAWFSIIDGEWPAVRAALEAWLAPENFDAEGRQRAGLAALRRPDGLREPVVGKLRTMIFVEHLEEWRGQEVIDPEGENVGKLEEVFYPEGSDDAALIAIKSGLLGRKTRIAPLAGASLGRSYLRVAHSKATVDRGPDLPGDTADAALVLAVREHYGESTAPGDVRMESATARATREREAQDARARALEAEARAADARAGADEARQQAEDAHRRAEAAAAEEAATRQAAQPPREA